jgi:hypothetical protein
MPLDLSQWKPTTRKKKTAVVATTMMKKEVTLDREATPMKGKRGPMATKKEVEEVEALTKKEALSI